jgi:hypothetical protein
MTRMQLTQATWNKKSGGTMLSKFDYQYDVVGRITQWTQQADAATPSSSSSFPWDNTTLVL